MELRVWIEELKENWPACFGLLQGPESVDRSFSPELLRAVNGEMLSDPGGLQLITLLMQRIGGSRLSTEERIYLQSQGVLGRTAEEQ